MMEIRIEQLLERRRRTFYWLSKETGISHTTLWRLKKGKALGINFDTLEKLCAALECQPGDVLSLNNEKRIPKQRKAKSQSGSTTLQRIRPAVPG
jgi:putative transcriptional regulator